MSQVSISATLRQKQGPLHHQSLTSAFVTPFFKCSIQNCLLLAFDLLYWCVASKLRLCCPLNQPFFSLCTGHQRCSSHERSHYRNSLSLIRLPFPTSALITFHLISYFSWFFPPSLILVAVFFPSVSLCDKKLVCTHTLSITTYFCSNVI